MRDVECTHDLNLVDVRIVVLVRKNVIFQAVSMIRAVQLADRCGNDGWSKVEDTNSLGICIV